MFNVEGCAVSNGDGGLIVGEVKRKARDAEFPNRNPSRLMDRVITK